MEGELIMAIKKVVEMDLESVVNFVIEKGLREILTKEWWALFTEQLSEEVVEYLKLELEAVRSIYMESLEQLGEELDDLLSDFVGGYELGEYLVLYIPKVVLFKEVELKHNVLDNLLDEIAE